MRGTRDNTSSSERVVQLTDAHTLEREIQRSIDRYYKWLIELCRRTTGMDPSLSGERIGRLRRRRDREFNRLMYRYSAPGVHDPRLGSSLPLLKENMARLGSIQITGRANYEALARDAGLLIVTKGARSN